ncbi:MAG: hypothetical protein E7I78_12405, partial [Staphylococcus lugdunensis]|nr:hypothetical protein [Staphylococcus lugdunensis]
TLQLLVLNTLLHLLDHFDIAGPATIAHKNYNGPKGATGYLIPTIVKWLQQLT